MTERRACRLANQPRGTQRFRVIRREDEDALTQAIVQLASQYGRYGYRRITALLKRAGWRVGKDRVERIWRREGLKVPQKQKPRGRLWLNDGSCVRLIPERRNHVWSYDFVSARTHDGRSLRLLNLIDEHTRESLLVRAERRSGYPAFLCPAFHNEFVQAVLPPFHPRGVMLLRGPNAFVTQCLADIANGDATLKVVTGERVPQSVACHVARLLDSSGNEYARDAAACPGIHDVSFAIPKKVPSTGTHRVKRRQCGRHDVRHHNLHMHARLLPGRLHAPLPQLRDVLQSGARQLEGVAHSKAGPAHQQYQGALILVVGSGNSPATSSSVNGMVGELSTVILGNAGIRSSHCASSSNEENRAAAP